METERIDDEDLPVAADEGIWYRWRCPHCECVNETENDLRGSRVTCEDCGLDSRHAS